MHSVSDGFKKILHNDLPRIASPQNAQLVLILGLQKNLAVHFQYVTGKHMLKFANAGDYVKNASLQFWARDNSLIPSNSISSWA